MTIKEGGFRHLEVASGRLQVLLSSRFCGGSSTTSTAQLANCCDSQGRSALHRAAFHGDMEEVEGLLAAGADIEAEDKEGQGPGSFGREHGDDVSTMNIMKL